VVRDCKDELGVSPRNLDSGGCSAASACLQEAKKELASDVQNGRSALTMRRWQGEFEVFHSLDGTSQWEKLDYHLEAPVR
jgi:hypothetical protein